MESMDLLELQMLLSVSARGFFLRTLTPAVRAGARVGTFLRCDCRIRTSPHASGTEGWDWWGSPAVSPWALGPSDSQCLPPKHSTSPLVVSVRAWRPRIVLRELCAPCGVNHGVRHWHEMQHEGRIRYVTSCAHWLLPELHFTCQTLVGICR